MTVCCPVCHSAAAMQRGELFRCSQCDHLFQHPPRVTVHYDQQYLATYDRYPTTPMAQLRLGFMKGFMDGGRLLDVGYGQGDFVKAALVSGFDAFGADVHGVDHGVREVSLRDDRTEWDVITFFDSLEHFPDFEAIRQLIERTKHVLVSVPLPPATFPQSLNWRHYKPGEHLHYFSKDSLSQLIGRPILRSSNVEDGIRRGTPGVQNILTVMFGNSSV